MLEEEWRIHARLFGGQAFALFPVLIASISAVVYAVVYMANVTPLGIKHGLHYVMLFLGLNVGTIGFISRDAIKNVLGEQNLLVFSSRTLPISHPRILMVFLVKDFLYYAFLMILPILLGLMPSALYFGTAITAFPMLWLTTTGMFMLGVSLSFLFATVYQRSRTYTAFTLAVVLGSIGILGRNAVQLTPIAVFLESFHAYPSLSTVVTGFLPIFGFTIIGLILFSNESRRHHRTRDDRFARLSARVSRYIDTSLPLTLKTVLELSRSSGGVFKLLFSQGVIFVLFIGILVYVPEMYPAPDSPVLALSVILSIGSLSTYSWINRFDRDKDYLHLPLDLRDVFREKMYAYFLLSLPIGYAYLVLAGTVFGFDWFVLSTFLFPLISMYLFGAIAHTAGLNPDRMLFNVERFLVFAALLGVVIVPLFVAIFLLHDRAYMLATFLITLSALAAGAGHTMYETASHRHQNA